VFEALVPAPSYEAQTSNVHRVRARIRVEVRIRRRFLLSSEDRLEVLLDKG